MPFHGQSPDVKAPAPKKVSSATLGGLATPRIRASQPTVTIQASAPGSQRLERSATCDAACADAVSQRVASIGRPLAGLVEPEGAVRDLDAGEMVVEVHGAIDLVGAEPLGDGRVVAQGVAERRTRRPMHASRRPG